MTNLSKGWNLLVVDDDIYLREGLANFLRQSGHNVVECAEGNEAVQLAIKNEFDAIVLDLLLPEISGLQFLGIFRKVKQTPVIMISSMTEVDYRLSAFQSDVDDFLVKPISNKEVLERIRAILRRTQEDSSETIRIRNVEIDLNAKCARLDGAIVHLSPTEFELLALLAKNQGRILARSILQDSVLGPNRQEYGNIIDQYIMRLRRKLGKDLIATKVGMGFVIYA